MGAPCGSLGCLVPWLLLAVRGQSGGGGDGEVRALPEVCCRARPVGVGEVAGADDTGRFFTGWEGNHRLARTQEAEELGPTCPRERARQWEAGALSGQLFPTGASVRSARGGRRGVGGVE